MSAIPGSETHPMAGDEGARAQADRITALLDEVRVMAGPPAWQRVEELVQSLVGLYGTGIERLLELVSEAGAFDDRLKSLLCDDDLVSSLLVLHGLHPVSAITRVQKAIDRLRPQLGVDVAFVGVDADGVAHLRLRGHVCASSRATIERAIVAAIEAAAPEVTRVEVDAGVAEKLVQIDLRRSRAAARGEEPR